MEGNELVVEVPAKVSVPAVGMEVPVISKERWEQMRRWRAEGPTQIVLQKLGPRMLPLTLSGVAKGIDALRH